MSGKSMTSRRLILTLFFAVAFSAYSEEGNKTIIDATEGSGADLKKTWANIKTGDIIELYGLVRRVGNDPFSALLITDEAGNDWFLSDASIKGLALPEHGYVTVLAKVERKRMVLANGKVLEDRRILTIVKRN